MQSFRERFDAMVSELRAHPEVEIFAVEIRPPAEPETLELAELVLEQPLPAAMRAFYAAHNGIFLEWGLKGVEYLEKTLPFWSASTPASTGCFNFVPLESVISEKWERECFISEISPEFQQLLFGAVPDPQPPFRGACVDLFSSWSQGNLIIGPEPLMIVSADHGAELDTSHFLSFDVYLDVTLAMYGISRRRVLGTRQPKRVTQCDVHWTLDEAIQNLKEP